MNLFSELLPKCCHTHAPTHVTGPSCKLSIPPYLRPTMVLPILVGTSGNVAPRTHIKSHEVRLVWSTFAAAVWASVLHARGRRRMHGSVHGRRDPRVRSRARISRAARRAWGRRMRCWSVTMAVAVELALRGTSLAADPRFPDWPCNQIKVPEISVAAVWAGPSIDDVGNAWEEDATIKDLVARLAARRTPLDDAQKAIADAITGTESERQKKAKLIFAGLFKTLNDERSDVMRGIERYARKQKEFSDQIRSTILQLRELQDRPNPDQGRIDDLTNRVEWDTRIFEERRKTMNIVCEVPVLIEQRLFALARAIQQSLE